jgi:hypothetical protein
MNTIFNRLKYKLFKNNINTGKVTMIEDARVRIVCDKCNRRSDDDDVYIRLNGLWFIDENETESDPYNSGEDGDDSFEFCCIECLVEWLKEHIDEEQVSKKTKIEFPSKPKKK